jgi:aminopeptidase N
MGGFYWTVQRDILQPYTEQFFQRVPSVFETRENEFARSYFSALFPDYLVDPAVLDRSEQLLNEVGDRQPMLARMLREANDDLARAIACRRFAAS